MSFGRKPLANLQELEAAAARSGMIGNDEIAAASAGYAAS